MSRTRHRQRVLELLAQVERAIIAEGQQLASDIGPEHGDVALLRASTRQLRDAITQHRGVRVRCYTGIERRGPG